jgi:hypothetical protein
LILILPREKGLRRMAVPRGLPWKRCSRRAEVLDKKEERRRPFWNA